MNDKIKEQEWHFEFRGESLGVMDKTLQGAYGYFYSTYKGVTEAELDDAYDRGNEWRINY